MKHGGSCLSINLMLTLDRRLSWTSNGSETISPLPEFDVRSGLRVPCTRGASIVDLTVCMVPLTGLSQLIESFCIFDLTFPLHL